MLGTEKITDHTFYKHIFWWPVVHRTNTNTNTYAHARIYISMERHARNLDVRRRRYVSSTSSKMNRHWKQIIIINLIFVRKWICFLRWQCEWERNIVFFSNQQNTHFIIFDWIFFFFSLFVTNWYIWFIKCFVGKSRIIESN